MAKLYVPGWSPLPDLNEVIKQDMKEQSLNQYMDQSNESVVSKPLDYWDHVLMGLSAFFS